jgi:uncharacterized protein
MKQDIATVLDEANDLLHRMGGQKPVPNLNEALIRVVSGNSDSIYGGLEMTRKLIVVGTDINSVDQYGRTPLHLAVRCYALSTVRLLLQSRADVNAQDQFGDTPLKLAVSRSSIDAMDMDLIKTILKAGSDVNLPDMTGATPLVTAVRHQEIGLVRLLVDSGASVTVTDQNGNGVLHDIVKVADRSAEKSTAKPEPKWVKQADRKPAPRRVLKSVRIIGILVMAGADVNATDNDGNTPLHLARTRNHKQCIEVLLKCGAKEDIKNFLGLTAADVSEKVTEDES